MKLSAINEDDDYDDLEANDAFGDDPDLNDDWINVGDNRQNVLSAITRAMRLAGIPDKPSGSLWYETRYNREGEEFIHINRNQSRIATLMLWSDGIDIEPFKNDIYDGEFVDFREFSEIMDRGDEVIASAAQEVAAAIIRLFAN